MGKAWQGILEAAEGMVTVDAAPRPVSPAQREGPDM